MKLAVITVTENGDNIASLIKNKFDEVVIYSKFKCEDFNFKEVVKKAFLNYDGVVFITSTGIAVRAIVPYVKSKDKDPAVITIDNSGKFVISLLSGHLGGANELTLNIANLIDATPVITTATDNLGVVAPDMVAKDNNLVIDDLKDAKRIASLLVKGEKVCFYDEDKIIPTPNGYINDLDKALGVLYVTNKCNLEKIQHIDSLKLIRKNIVLGIGCKKDFPEEVMRERVLETLKHYNIDYRSIKSIGTVEIKKNEKAIISLGKFLNCNVNIFTIDEIRVIQHKFTGSDFVEKTIGVRTVCEPCTELQGGKIFSGKLKLNGMTLCIGKVD